MKTKSDPSEPVKTANPPPDPSTHRQRIVSIDALRGLVVFAMIFVNDLDGVSHKIVPAWMRHFEGKSGMTFVDLVFPAFLFIVGMSIPFALGSRLNQRNSLWKAVAHVLVRTVSLLGIGILMVHGNPSAEKMGWSGTWWSVLMYCSAIVAFSTITLSKQEEDSGRQTRTLNIFWAILRAGGALALICLALAYRGENGQRIVTLSPFSIQTSWYGILGLIGWAYGVGAVVFLLFRFNRTALLGSMALLLCLYPAARTGAFDHIWLSRYIGIGEVLGALPSITVAGIILSTIFVTPDTSGTRSRLKFTLWFITACTVGALLLHGLYGINKNSATPSWCLWACAITAALWLLFHWISESRLNGFIARPFSIAGQNVLLAYLLSEMLPSVLELLRVGDWYGSLAEPNLACAIARSAGCAVALLALTAGLNKLGFRLRL
jgi:predicted acyltransferase